MMMFSKPTVIVYVFLITLFHYISGSLSATDTDEALIEEVRTSIDKGISFFHSISTEGGYVYNVTVDLKRRWGESELDAQTIEVQSPGTPAVGMTFLQAYRISTQWKLP